MYDSTAQRDYIRTEMEYRLDRIRDDIVGRRRRRWLRQHRNSAYGTDR
jgi:hypothetical protein